MEDKKIVFDLYQSIIFVERNENENIWRQLAFYYSYHGANYKTEELKQRFFFYKEEKDELQNILKKLYLWKKKYPTLSLLKSTVLMYRASTIQTISIYPEVKERLQALRCEGWELFGYSSEPRWIAEAELKVLGLNDIEIVTEEEGKCLIKKTLTNL